ncbi:hypothetical protein VNO78_21623 [Psophocarpus tetragonolobus]|uniref:Uncharacterized protein n=1 Tax=Psophocarpus tetragonolobus TaxID=3891 RepID=A0AAN9XI83_PSOTE
MNNLHGGGGGTKGDMLGGGEREEGFSGEDAAQMRIKKKVTKWANDLHEGEMAICTLAPRLFRCGEAQRKPKNPFSKKWLNPRGGVFSLRFCEGKGEEGLMLLSQSPSPIGRMRFPFYWERVSMSGGFLQVVLSMAKGDDSILKISVQEDPMLKSPSRYVVPSISKYEDPPPELAMSAFLLPHSFLSDQFDMLLTMGKVGDFVLDEG